MKENLTQEKFIFNLISCQELSENALSDLRASGLTDETIREMGVLPLTPETFKEFVGRKLVESDTRQPIVLEGYVIPYRHVSPPFGRVKVLKWNTASRYYQQTVGAGKELPKYLQPSSAHREQVVYAYALPSALKKINSPKTTYLITEGEKKTAKLQQELNKLETEYQRYLAIGLGGVWNWNPFVFKQLGASFKDRKVYLCFDADGKFNPSVAEAGISLYSYLLSQGALFIKSLDWDATKGKGIDDYLVSVEAEGRAPEEALRELMDSAVSPVELYKDTVTLQTAVSRLADYLIELPEFVVEELKKHYKVGKREIKRLFRSSVEQRRKKLEEKLKEKAKEELQLYFNKTFGIDFIPELSKGFRIENGELCYKDESICEAFVVSEFSENIDEGDGGYITVLSFAGSRKIAVSNKVVSSAKLFTSSLHEEGIVVSEREAKTIQDYLAKFIRLNRERIFRSYYSTKTGWIRREGGDAFVHPTVSEIQLLLSRDLLEGLRRAGSREKELKAVEEIISRYPKAGLLWVMGIATSVASQVLGDDSNLVVLVQGETGSGKTTAIKGAVSFFGNPNKLKRSFNFSEGGFEGFISSLRDVPIHLEEVKQLDSNPARRAVKFIDFVYKFVEGMGRTRMRIDLSLRNTATYRGTVFTSSEMGIDEILSRSSDSYYEGIFRRVLAVVATKEQFGGEKLSKLVEKLSRNYGNLLPEWISYFKANRSRIEELFRERDADFSEAYKLDAKPRRFLALVSVVIEEIGNLFKIDTSPLWDALEEVGSFNEALYGEYVLGEESSLKRRIEEFLEEVSSTGTIVEQENAYGKPERPLRDCRGEFLVYKRVQKKDREIVGSKVYLTSKGLSELASRFGMGRNLLKSKLEQAGLIGERKKLTVLTLGDSIHLYPLLLEAQEQQYEDAQDDLLGVEL